MSDDGLIAQIEALVAEEHTLRAKHPDGLDPEEQARMHHLDVHLDQLWDLLRQRRARREVHLPEDFSAERDEKVVEGYQQ
ncbi:MAG TPA: DUF2630 family protein [Ilumatobacteraceae bacterium]